jgi:hypothetical protein
MTNVPPDKTQQILGEFLKENELTGESVLFRSSLGEHLTETNQAGRYLISANGRPSESVIDIYESGHLILAERAGPGLAFTLRRANDWKTDDRKLVEVKIQDVLDQGGLLYPVESVIVAKVWYLTLPKGDVEVRLVE